MIGARLLCSGCGTEVAWHTPLPWRCPQAHVRTRFDGIDPARSNGIDPARSDAIDHVLQRHVAAPLGMPDDPIATHEPLPFVRFRERLFSYHRAIAAGMNDADFVALVRTLDARTAAVDGVGFRQTPLLRSAALAARLGLPEKSALWCKDETENVSGSHKGRHLFGLLLEILVDEALQSGRSLLAVADDPAAATRPLAIASCGNAALAAAVLARAAQRRLQVFIPPTAPASVQARLRALGAEVTICARPLQPAAQDADAPPGDPTYHAFLAAVAGGALPFCCQGPDNGLTIQGGQTIVYELLASLGSRRARLRHLFVQVGGGALFSAVAAALDEAVQSGVLPTRPQLYAVQTQTCAPLFRAYERLLQHASQLPPAWDPRPTGPTTFPDGAARLLMQPARRAQALHFARQHRAQFMWPWTYVGEPHSLAHGILDDETYDWAAALQGLAIAGGYPVLVSEPDLAQAQAAARAAGFSRVDATGAAGLAGLIAAARDTAFLSSIHNGDDVAVLWTGAER